MPTRQQLLERKKAVETALQMKDSKVGTCVLKDNARQTNMFGTRVSRMEHELRRGQMHLEQEKKVFLKMRAARQLDPTVLMVRPGSAGRRLMRRSPNTDSTASPDIPGYMRPLKNDTREPTKLATLDAFMRQSQRMKRPWELMDSTQRPVFRPCAFPSAPLTTPEAVNLQQSASLQKIAEEHARVEDFHKQMRKRSVGLAREKSGRARSEADSFDTTAFITQISGLQHGEGLNPRVRFVGVRSPPPDDEAASPTIRKTLNLPTMPDKRRKSQTEEKSRFKSRFAQLDFEGKLQNFEDMTKPMASEWYRMKKRNQRLPSADGLNMALRDDALIA